MIENDHGPAGAADCACAVTVKIAAVIMTSNTMPDTIRRQRFNILCSEIVSSKNPRSYYE